MKKGDSRVLEGGILWETRFSFTEVRFRRYQSHADLFSLLKYLNDRMRTD